MNESDGFFTHDHVVTDKRTYVEEDGTLIVYYTITLPQPLGFIEFYVDADMLPLFKKEEDRTGMIFNPYSNKWSFL
jgi:hypothetical protein